MQLHRALNDPEVPAPYEWIVSRVCEEFNCLPTRAQWELENDPDGMAIRIIKLRAYAAAKRAFDEAQDAGQLEKALEANPMVKVAQEIAHEIAADEWRAQKVKALEEAEAEAAADEEFERSQAR